MSARNRPGGKRVRRMVRAANVHSFTVSRAVSNLLWVMAYGHIVVPPNRQARRGNPVAGKHDHRMS